MLILNSCRHSTIESTTDYLFGGITAGKCKSILSSPLWMDLAGSGGGPDKGALLAGEFLYGKSRFS